VGENAVPKTELNRGYSAFLGKLRKSNMGGPTKVEETQIRRPIASLPNYSLPHMERSGKSSGGFGEKKEF